MPNTKKTRHPLLLLLDIAIVVLTFILAITIAVFVVESRDSNNWRLSPDNYRYDLESGNYRSLTRSFCASGSAPAEEEITPELRPYAAIAAYYRDTFCLQIYKELGDTVRVDETSARLAASREAMGVFSPEADKIDKIFDSTP